MLLFHLLDKQVKKKVFFFSLFILLNYLLKQYIFNKLLLKNVS